MIDQAHGRNAPCPCGSGKRYKDCHGALARGVPAALAPATDVDALLERAQTELSTGDAAAGLATCQDALARAGDRAAAWNVFGLALRATGSNEAEAAWRRALVLDPDNAEARFYLGNLYREGDQPHAAIAEYEQALRSTPSNTALLNNLGLALEAAGESDRALECYTRVLAVDPWQSDALGNLANIQFARSEFDACAKTYDRMFAVRKDIPVPVLVRRGIALQKSLRPEDAEACFREAAVRAPDDAQILANIGSLCVERGRYGDADAPLVRAIELDPANRYALSMLIHARQHRCAWAGIDPMFNTLQRLIDEGPTEISWNVAPFPLLSMPLSLETHLKAARSWARGFGPAKPPPRPHVSPAPDARLRVGFVSSDFRPHPMVALMMEVWERIDRQRIETFAYGIAQADTGPVGQRIARAFEHFADLSVDSATVAAQRIRSDDIAILFDLNGYTKKAKPDIFAMRPAPIQVNCIGFPGTLGADCYDYIYVDRFVAPPSAQVHYAERFFHMPHSNYPSDTSRAPQGPAPSRAACGLPGDAFVFCCFNNAYKILPDIFAVWMRLLGAVRDSVLWLLEGNADAVANLRREAASAGVDPGRLIFAPRVSSAEHLARHAAADLFVDTLPYGAHTTANDALLAGLPVLTCVGETLPSRISGSQLRAIGLADMVTTSIAEYEALALRLARAPAELAAIRKRVAENRGTHPLFDMARYTRDLEDGLFGIWRDYTTALAVAAR